MKQKMEEFVLKIWIGVDVSKGYADFEFLNEAGTFLPDGSRFDDTAEGQRQLKERILQVRKKNRECHLVVGMEATGGLERNWEKFFRKLKKEFEMDVFVLNPFAVKKFLERNLRRSRTDRISAKNIAEYLAVGRRRQDVDYEPEMQGGRSLYRCILAATGRRVQAQCQLQSLLPSVQPELVQFCRDGIPEWILDLLICYPTAGRLARAKVKTLSRKNQVAEKKAANLIAAAKTSVASLEDEHIQNAIVSLAREIQDQNRNIANLQAGLIASLKNDPDVQIIDSVTGIGTWSAIILRLEYGRVERFHSAAAAVAFAGLDPRIDKSGDMEQQLGISRAGHTRIRSALYMPTMAAVRFNPVIHKFYNRLIANGKEHKLALVACMRKLIHIIYACCVTGKSFDPTFESQRTNQQINRATTAAGQQLNRTAEGDLTAPVSRKEAKRRRAAALPQKGVLPLMRGPATANENNTSISKKIS